jgi:hypothetical protein
MSAPDLVAGGEADAVRFTFTPEDSGGVPAARM